MSWSDRLCLGRAQRCEGYRGAPCDCFGPWTDAELADAQELQREMTAASTARSVDTPVSASRRGRIARAAAQAEAELAAMDADPDAPAPVRARKQARDPKREGREG
jgi:hypothetical protein